MESIDLMKEMISLVKSRTLKYYVIAVSGVFLLLVMGNKTAGGGIYFALLLTYLVSLWLMLKRGMINATVVRFSILCNFLLSLQRIQIDLIETNYIFKRGFDLVSHFMVVGGNVVEMLAVIFIVCFGVYVAVALRREEREGRLPGVG